VFVVAQDAGATSWHEPHIAVEVSRELISTHQHTAALTDSVKMCLAVYKQLLVVGVVVWLMYPRSANTYFMNLNADEQKQIVDYHNKLRRKEGSSNMQLMTWNGTLAEKARLWAAKCIWEHGGPPVNPGKTKIDYGQNLAMDTFPKPNLTFGIQAWYDEKPGYDLDTMDCDTSKIPADTCGHYTQVVWANSRQVGCAYYRCQNGLDNRPDKTAAWYLVCNYLPTGNYDGQKPYRKGPSCSQCGSGAGWCDARLCNSACTGEGRGCACAARCHNCAELVAGTCHCQCDVGWTGPACTKLCKDYHVHCGANPGWPRSWCTNPKKQSQMVHCPALCGKCTPDPDAKEGKCKPKHGKGVYNDEDDLPDKEEEGTSTSRATTTVQMTKQQQQLMMMMMMMMMTSRSPALL